MDKLKPAIGTVEELVHCVKKWGAHPNAWLEALTGQRVRGDLKSNIAEVLARPTSAATFVDSLSPLAIIALGLLTEKDRDWPFDLFNLELGRIIGDARAERAMDELTSRGLSFEGRAFNGWTPCRTRMLPKVLKTWLRPELDGLLQATDDLDEIADAGSVPDGVFDPSLDLAFVVAGMATLRPRVTVDDGRLFARERTKLGAMLGLGDSPVLDLMIHRLTSAGLLLENSDLSQPRLEPHWPVVAKWAQLSVPERVRLQLAHRLDDDGARSILAANGAWVSEGRVRRHHMMAPPDCLPPKRDALANAMDDSWRNLKRTIEGWPEVEVSSQAGTWAARLRPHLAAALSGRVCPSAKLHVQASFEVLVPREAALADVVFVARVADLVKVDTVATFRITRDSARRAVMSGLSLDEMDATLARMAAFGVPESVGRSLRDFVGNMGRCTVRDAVLVEFDNAQLASKAAGVLGDHARLVTPTIFEVSRSEQDSVLERLDRAGMAPRETRISPARPTPRLTPGDDPEDDPDYWEDDHDPDDWGGRRSQAIRSPADRFAAIMATTRESWPTLALGLHLPPARIAAVRAVRKQAQGEACAPPAPRVSTAVDTRPRDKPKLSLVPARPRTAGPSPALPIERLGPLATAPDRIRRTLLLAASIDAEVAATSITGQPLRFRPIEIDDSASPTVRIWQGDAVTTVPLADLAQVAVVPASARRLGRNQPCPCEGGRKFKRCCGSNAQRP